jgi:uncharacterized OsmC-like protein
MTQETAAVKVMTNGVDVDALFENIDAFKANTSLAEFKFYQTSKWIDGGHNRSSVANFYGAGATQEQRAQPFVLDADEPPLLLGTDKGANPVEYLLHAVTACVTTSMIYHAAARGIKIESLESRTEGDIDLRGFLAIDETVPVGFQDIRMVFKIKSDAPEEAIQKLIEEAPSYSPVFSTITQSCKVNVSREE